MGCGSSTGTAVQPLTPQHGSGDEGDRGSKLHSCGDSAVSKGTTDSGVVMEVLPGAVPRILPPLTSEWMTAPPGFLQQDITAQERQNSSEILEELLNQGIIPIGQSRERSCGAGEAYSIMLKDTEVVKRRPPARLESLKAKKEQTVTSIEDIEEKIRLAEERRKLREDELKMRLRAKSARVRAPISRTEEDEDVSTVEQLQPLSSGPGVECVRETEGGSKEGNWEMGRAEEREGTEKAGVNGGENRERTSEDNDEEEQDRLNEVEEFLIDQEEFETDSSFQHAENMETF